MTGNHKKNFRSRFFKELTESRQRFRAGDRAALLNQAYRLDDVAAWAASRGQAWRVYLLASVLCRLTHRVLSEPDDSARKHLARAANELQVALEALS